MYESMCKSSIQHWNELTLKFLDQTENLFARMILQRLDNVFGPWNSTKLYAILFDTCSAFVRTAMLDQRTASTRNFDLEVYKPMTFNEETIKQASDKAEVLLRERRRRQRADVFLQQNESKNSKSSWEEKVSKVTDQQLGEDPYKQEIMIMSVCLVSGLCEVNRLIGI